MASVASKAFTVDKTLLGQIIRFGLTGGFLTVLVAGGYWLVARFLHVDPNLSLLINFLVFSSLGYFMHSRISFKGHGERDPARAHVRTIRFFIVNIIGFLSNQLFVLLLVKWLHLPVWTPTIPIIFFTPLLTFSLNRRWVFG